MSGRWAWLAAGLWLAACGGKKTHDADTSGRGGSTSGGGDGGSSGDGAAPEPASCVDGVQNGEETDVDCDGACPPCERCDDGIRNFAETDVDCGGGGRCAQCPIGSECHLDEDCESGVCLGYGPELISRCARAECANQRRDENETDVDCGGPDCKFCYLGQTCQSMPDCGGAHCDGFCQMPCASDPECEGGGACEGGLCVYCRDPSDCAPGQCGEGVTCLCRNGYCSRY